jgi:TonB family protein
MRLPLSLLLAILSLEAVAPGQQTRYAANTPSLDFSSTAASENSSAASIPMLQPADSIGLELLRMKKPSYPGEARKRGIQGQVSLHVDISEAGFVENVKPISGHPLLIPAAIAAVKRWRYKPFLRKGHPVKVSTTVPVDFAFAINVQEILVDVGAPQPSSGTTDPQPATIPGEVMMARLIHKVAPVYPSSARKNHIEGTVVLQAMVGNDGRISNLTVISGPREFLESAIGAVQQWRYRPFAVNGGASQVTTEIQLKYELH